MQQHAALRRAALTAKDREAATLDNCSIQDKTFALKALLFAARSYQLAKTEKAPSQMNAGNDYQARSNQRMNDTLSNVDLTTTRCFQEVIQYTVSRMADTSTPAFRPRLRAVEERFPHWTKDNYAFTLCEISALRLWD